MKKVLVFVFLALIAVSAVMAQMLPPGIPREKTLILPFLFAPLPAPGNWNLWAGWRAQNCGLHQFVTEPLWTINPNPEEGGIINALAAEPPIYNEDFTKLTIKLRKGIYWSDGVEFTADDVVFTIKTVKDTSGLDYHGPMQDVKDVYALDKYTVVVELKRPNSRFHAYFVERWGALRPMPKHIFEKVEDVVSFDFNPPVSLGPYVLKDYDPAGYWVLWEKRKDWQRTVTGQLFGEPVPEYVLFINYGTPEKNTMAMLRHELDVLQGSAEQLITLLRMSKTTRSYRKTWPYIDPRDISTRGPGFNHMVYPYNIKDVRWALALSIDIVKLAISTYDGMVAMTPGLPLVVNKNFYEWYFKRLEPWLEELTLDLGNGETFKPWDPKAPWRLLEWAKKMYKVDIDPNSEEEVRLTLGYGWWKYAPDAAEKLLKKHGFYRDENGKWHLPNGDLWKITILRGPDPTDMANIIIEGIAEQWKEFGIEVVFNVSSAASTLAGEGRFEVVNTAHGGFAGEPWGFHPDLYRCFNAFRSEFVKPIGELTLGSALRWSDPRMDKIIEELEKTDWNDYEKVIELGVEGLKLEIEEMVAIPVFNCPITIVFDEYYWTNFPSPENDYARCDNFTTWPQLKYLLHMVKPAK
ncbi:peptide ABC transporter substrate-binding protein [Thermotoga maritima MSB8]|uniref:Oligopeptide ABC transporter, periplasmic oligopeptide-binding protein n=1 Tax=Thermotoga maritima (strain ATCC 43589 / DSM 3109 / JCM 10099 / NBRC 100826 / MSB8) TaxID=243274 RepID=Q9X0S6_THEMA|nr:ABC transporter substrate-binding protein [Thermotoga maritima]AAD36274.1 oligopeptide ABC transporter, periplasmic oligopeptide-binding protein [Thermotoga maritima MSB8]AGL50130.1 Xyloglucan ABC transport system, sugar-binding protein [Thermotoga maritima MSB8]AHD18894.1 peptide ABC transporter substrate-binding protein [Thermotoga maritima MSB8]AKE27110.1 peptide ABC transporter substrate-binding protein [Thermotoga maritima]AKE28975.1 peptide ABC transporter substrate-binding protein [T